MKLVFPDGDHPQVLLGLGINRVGSDPHSNIVIDRPGVLPQHCQLHVSAAGVMLDVPHGIPVSVNGRRVDGLIALRPGDSMAFDRVQARLASLETTAGIRPDEQRALDAPAANDDPGVTAVRSATPRYVLRGLSGNAMGQQLPIHGVVMIGRAPECQLRLDDEGMSRRHARLLPTETGIQVEDLGSTNGTYINGKRVLRGEAKVGDVIAFDVLQLRVAKPGQKAEPVPAVAKQIVAKQVVARRAAAKPARRPEASAEDRQTWLWLGVAAVIAVAAVAGVWLLH
jgi:pSer/pThr/pTyr-binding forkhead associated (FHA) protein